MAVLPSLVPFIFYLSKYFSIWLVNTGLLFCFIIPALFIVVAHIYLLVYTFELFDSLPKINKKQYLKTFAQHLHRVHSDHSLFNFFKYSQFFIFIFWQNFYTILAPSVLVAFYLCRFLIYLVGILLCFILSPTVL